MDSVLVCCKSKLMEKDDLSLTYLDRWLRLSPGSYAQIEKEALALTWACERYSEYLIGLQFSIETDHKPLVPLFDSKLLDELPIRVQRFRMRMMRFNFSIYHVPGKNLTIADTSSRAPCSSLIKDDNLLQDETDAYIQVMIQTLPATENRLEEIKRRQEEDEVCKQIVKYCQKGWPSIKSIPQALKEVLPSSSWIVSSEWTTVERQ